MIVVALTKAIEAQSDIVYGLHQRDGNLRRVARSMMLRACLQLAAGGAALAATRSVIAMAVAMAVVSLLTYLLYDRPRSRTVEDGARQLASGAGRLLTLAWQAFPLGVSAAIISLNLNVVRFLIGTIRTSADLGIYAVLSYPLVAGNLVIGAVSTATLARLAHDFAHDQYREFGKLLGNLLALACALAVVAIAVGWVAGPAFLRVVFGEEYGREAPLFRILLLGMGIGFVNWFLNSALTASRKYHAAMALQVLSLVLTVGIGWWFISEWGVKGAAWATALVLSINVVAKLYLIGSALLTLHRAAVIETGMTGGRPV